LNYYKLLAITLSPSDTPFWRRFWMESCVHSLQAADDYDTYNEGPLTRDDAAAHDTPDWSMSEGYPSEDDGSTHNGSTDEGGGNTQDSSTDISDTSSLSEEATSMVVSTTHS
jgi:hypothetical protein